MIRSAHPDSSAMVDPLPHLTTRLRVGIDARLRHGESGGVESITIGLAEGLSRLGGDEEYVFLTLQGSDDWIRPHLRGNASALPLPSATKGWVGRLGSRLARSNSVAASIRRSVRRRGKPAMDRRCPTEPSKRAGVDVMHFLNQAGFRTVIPSIYHPHDLQHRHLPELFTAEQLAYREIWYEAMCAQADTVAVASSWTREDVIKQLALPPDRVAVVPWAPPLDVVDDVGQAEVATIATSLQLPGKFVMYPAQTWAHKNHIGLVRALSLIRSRSGPEIPLVLTGLRNSGASVVDAEIRRCGVSDLVTWTGFLEPRALRAVYQRATAVVIPSRFEAASGPLWEAFSIGTAVACSRVTSLPRQAGDAALLFDPESIEEMAQCILRIWEDEQLRADLVLRGRARVSRFSWDRTARLFRAHYRRVAGRSVTAEDAALLSATPEL